jgi:glycosyltransferase involved in cell wall biosynthesis
MTPALVSVVIPSYNYARFVTEAVGSALAQSYPHVEIIVVDDGSTDNTREVLEPFRDRIRYLAQTNQGLSAARNTGIRAAQGEFIALLDADDVWHPRKLEVQLSYLQEHPEIGLLATELFTEQLEEWPVIDVRGIVPRLFTLDDVVGRGHFAPSSAVIRKNCLEAVGLFDPTLRAVEDRDMWIRLASQCGLAKLPLLLLWYRLHPQSLSSKAQFMEDHELRVLKKAFAQVPALRGRWLFRRKMYSQAAFASAQLFRASGRHGAALRRLLSSLGWWPLPLRVHDSPVRCVRLRVLLNLMLRMLGLRASDSPKSLVATAAPPPAAPAPRSRSGHLLFASSEPHTAPRVCRSY